MPLNDKAGLMKNLPHRLKKHCGAFFLLSLLVAALLSLGQVSARSVLMQDTTGHLVICSGDASVIIAVDSHGAPISDETSCPECSCLNPIDADMNRSVVLKTSAASRAAEALRRQDAYEKSIYSIQLRAPPSQVKSTYS
jgi:hypothetical protein